MRVFAAVFEVMDKEPSLFDIWLFAFVTGVGGFFLCRYRPWFLAVVLPIALIFAAGLLAELHDQFVGKYIVLEAGQSYLTHSYTAMAVQIVLPCLGLIARRRGRLR
jgi:hypothetical protein